MRLQQVFARAPDRDSRIRDDRDERQPRFFQRSVKVSIDKQDKGGAFFSDNERVPFGVEYLRQVTFREINFGEPSDDGAESVISGEEGIRPGFCVCAKCGTVQPRGDSRRGVAGKGDKDKPKHAFACGSDRPGETATYEHCLFLYRELQ